MNTRFVPATVLSIVTAIPVILPAMVEAQTSEATISGVVSDGTGGALPGVTVTAIHGETGQRHSAVTNAEGFYALRALPIGAYVIEAELSGFQRHRREGLTVTTGATVPLDIQLPLGERTETVTVQAEAPLLGARTSEISQLIESRSVEGMPLGDRRSMNLVRMTGAAVFVAYDSGQKPNFSLAGGRTQSQMFWIDGGAGQNMRLGIGQIDIDPPVDTVQEVKILSNNYAAEYGGSAGGVIIATTKSGTNQLRGSLFEYFRHDALDARDFFAPVVNGSKQKAPLRYNVFGGTVGGPMNRSFNTDAFAPPAPFTFGNSGRGILRGDGIINFDFSLAKNVALGPFDGGKSRSARFLQLRVELFNAFNHPNFGLPGHTFGAPDFGIVSSASGGRTVQLEIRGVF
jgi:hypothetical protein